MLQILQYLQILQSVAEFYTISRKFANVAEPTDVTDLSKYRSAFNGCNYCTDPKNVANVTKTLRKKKQQHYCAFKILQSVAELKNKNKCVKFAKLAEPSNVAELSNVTVLSKVANIVET